MPANAENHKTWTLGWVKMYLILIFSPSLPRQGQSVIMADPVVHSLSAEDNLRAAYHVLSDRIRGALRTQVGDTTRLSEIRTQAFLFLEAAQTVSILRTILIKKSLTVLNSTEIVFQWQSLHCCRLMSETW